MWQLWPATQRMSNRKVWYFLEFAHKQSVDVTLVLLIPWYSGLTRSSHVCCCHGSLPHQDISSHVGWTFYFMILRGRISSTCTTWDGKLWKMEIQLWVFSKTNPAGQRLNNNWLFAVDAVCLMIFAHGFICALFCCGCSISSHQHIRLVLSFRISIATCTWRRHDMDTLSALLALCEGNPPVTGGFLSQRASNAEIWCFFYISRISCWTNSHGGYVTPL